MWKERKKKGHSSPHHHPPFLCGQRKQKNVTFKPIVQLGFLPKYTGSQALALLLNRALFLYRSCRLSSYSHRPLLFSLLFSLGCTAVLFIWCYQNAQCLFFPIPYICRPTHLSKELTFINGTLIFAHVYEQWINTLIQLLLLNLLIKLLNKTSIMLSTLNITTICLMPKEIHIAQNYCQVVRFVIYKNNGG